MIYTFRSKAAGEFIMLGQHAKLLLKAAGKSDDTIADERGVFTPDQLAQAIAGLERAIGLSSDPEFDEDNPRDAALAQQYVSLRQRAQPMLDMLRRARDKNVDVMWEVSGR